MLGDRERWKQSSPLRDDGYLSRRDFMRAQSNKALTPPSDCSGTNLRWSQPHDGADEGRLPHAVAAEQGNNLSVAYVERHAAHHDRIAVAAVQIPHLKHDAASPDTLPGHCCCDGYAPAAPRRGPALEHAGHVVDQAERQVHVVLDQHERDVAVERTD